MSILLLYTILFSIYLRWIAFTLNVIHSATSTRSHLYTLNIIWMMYIANSFHALFSIVPLFVLRCCCYFYWHFTLNIVQFTTLTELMLCWLVEWNITGKFTTRISNKAQTRIVILNIECAFSNSLQRFETTMLHTMFGPAYISAILLVQWSF